jgi:hypothetical protein
MIKTRIANEDFIQQEWNNAGLEGPFPTLLRVCTQLLKQVKNEVTTIVKKSFQQREQEHKQHIESLSSSMKQSDKEEATRLRHLQKAEATKSTVHQVTIIATTSTKNRRYTNRSTLPKRRRSKRMQFMGAS